MIVYTHTFNNMAIPRNTILELLTNDRISINECLLFFNEYEDSEYTAFSWTS